MKRYKDFPLYIYVLGDQKAYLHQGNAKNVQEAIEQYQHIALDDDGDPTGEGPVAIIEVTNLKMFNMQEVKERFCPACGAIGKESYDCHCTR